MDFIVHIRQTDHEEQTVSEHCRQTAELAARYGQSSGLSASAELAGWLHDIGKLTADFNAYIRGDAGIHRGELDHRGCREYNSEARRKREVLCGDPAESGRNRVILAEVSGDDDLLHEYELRTEKWDSPVIAATMVQFLNALFSGKSSAVRRMHRLFRAVIIIVEVQSIPLKCVYLFNLAMNFLSACADRSAFSRRSAFLPLNLPEHLTDNQKVR